MEQADAACRPYLSRSLIEALLKSGDEAALAGIDFIQPALFAIQVSLPPSGTGGEFHQRR